MIASGIILLNYWLEVSEGDRWYDYSRAHDDMFAETDAPWAPWFVVRPDDKKRARLDTMTHLLRHRPHEEMRRAKIERPERPAPLSAAPLATMAL